MQVLILRGPDIRALLPMHTCMGLMENALQALARDEALLPLRSIMAVPNRHGAALLTMPAHLSSSSAGDETDTAGTLGLKVLTVFPGNAGTPFDAHQGAMLLFDLEHGSLRAVVDATEITALRTAAVSGVATRLLARPDAGDLALIGSGVQAHTHLDAMSVARHLRRVRVWSRTPDHVQAFVQREAPARDFPVVAASTAEEAVRDADIICTVTSASEPVLLGEWISAGAHINAVGAFTPATRELDSAAVGHSRLFVDRRESALSEAGDFLIPKQEGAFGDEHIQAELGEVLLGRAEGRRSRDEVTLFKSLGLAVEDVAAANYVWIHALELGLGTTTDL
jgi:alanine dehydrogenase